MNLVFLFLCFSLCQITATTFTSVKLFEFSNENSCASQMSVVESSCISFDVPSVCSYPYNEKARGEDYVQFLLNHTFQHNRLHLFCILPLCYIIFFKPYVPLVPLYFLFVPIYCTSRITFSYMHNLEVQSTKGSGSSTAEICTLTFLFYFSVEKRYRNQ